MSKEESIKDTYKYLVGGYYGVREMDEYPLKEFVLKDIEDYIDNYRLENPMPDFVYEGAKREVEDKRDLITKLQDALLVLPKVDASMELILMVKSRIKELKKEKNKKSF